MRKQLTKAVRSADEKFLDEALKDTGVRYATALREARKRNKLIEAERRIKNLKDELETSEDMLDEDYEEEEEEEGSFLEHPAMQKLFQSILQKQLGGSAAPTPQAEGLGIQNPSLMQQIATDKIKDMSDDELRALADQLK